MAGGKEGYPYIPGDRGIPFDALFTRAQSGERSGTFISGSNRKLDYLVMEDNISIADPEGEIYIMAALVQEGVASFAMHTKNPENPDERHRDMYAAKFVGIALDYFKSRGHNIQHCIDSWQPGTDTHKDFFDEYGKTGDKVSAAKSNWAGRTYMSNGFTEINESVINIFNDRVNVIFSKPGA